MNDIAGRQLEAMRIQAVLPFIRGRLLDIGCYMKRLAKVYDNGVGFDVYDYGNEQMVGLVRSHC